MTFLISKVFNVQKELIATVPFEVEPKTGDRLTIREDSYSILGSRRTFNEQGECSLEISVTHEKNVSSFKGEERVQVLSLGDGKTIEARTWS